MADYTTLTRRQFLETTVGATVVASTVGAGVVTARRAAKYVRANVASAAGKQALASYAKAVEAMLKLPADHPHNWFRIALVHLSDCPHGNWWFYPWHRGYLGFIEQAVREHSKDPAFAFPYWDWTTAPKVPAELFKGALDPGGSAYAPFTNNLAVFTSFMKPALTAYWKTLSKAQLAQLQARGFADLDGLWNDVTGFDTHVNDGLTGNVAFVNTMAARFLSERAPDFDEKTKYNSSPFVVYAGLLATDFSNAVGTLSFSSSKTPSHNTRPGKTTVFSTLEGLPHNKVHNCVAGVGPLDPGPYGLMANYLSPTDPSFFLHHANVDRLWDVWTRKQKALGLPHLPTGADLKTFADEPFLFFTDGKGNPVTTGKAGDYFDMAVFDYEYEPGFGEDIVSSTTPPAPPASGSLTKAVVKGNVASASVPTAAIKSHLAASRAPLLFAEITLPLPRVGSAAREFDVLVNAPANVTRVGADSPYYAGTIAFFGNMGHMAADGDEATFSVPLPRSQAAFADVAGATAAVNLRLVSTSGRTAAPQLRATSFRVR